MSRKATSGRSRSTLAAYDGSLGCRRAVASRGVAATEPASCRLGVSRSGSGPTGTLSPWRTSRSAGMWSMSRPAPESASATPPPPPEPTGTGWRVDPAPDGRGAPPPARTPRFPRSRWFTWVLVGVLVLNLLLSFMTGRPGDRKRVPYQPFVVDQVEAGNVKEISSRAGSIEGELKREATYDAPGDTKPVAVTKFKTEIPAFIDPAELTALLARENVVINAEPPDAGRSLLGSLVLGLLPTILLVGFFLWLYRRQAGGGGGILGAFGRSPARRVSPGRPERVCFDDVAGIDEAEQELAEVVDFLKNPGRYTKLGARVPRGVMLYG